MYNQKVLSDVSGTMMNDDDIDNLYASDGDENVELEETLNEEELEQLFRQVDDGLK